ncbi:ABC transporter permease [Desulfosporosinus shakirovi]|uniref:ABC transporter permease n=1 Tax=Desulfosporosinus shakirovi TaxID=2885154 RepID=UPI001E5FEDDA|nr:hypothetical protein [Desulfosporosinus sp. SRJS8]MCB8818590.1 hypothetical protein [Desulfosporosinus sp. SRJS8]
MINSEFAGTGRLIRLALHQNRILRMIWLLLPALIAIGTVSSYSSMFTTQQELLKFINESVSNPVVIGMHGHVLTATLAGLSAWKIKVLSQLIVGIFNIIVVIKLTRSEEESGRFELLGATVVGRQSHLAAALIVAFGTNLVMGLLITLGLSSKLPLAGSISMGLMIALSGCLFAAMAGIAAQLTDGARAASSIAISAFAAMFILSFLNNTNVESGGLLLITPFSWFFAIRPFAGDRFWIFAMILCLIFVFTIAAFILSSKRDVGEGIFHPRLGRSEAAPRFKSPLALSWRLQRGMLLGWTVALGVFGFGIGSVNQTVAKMFNESSSMASWVQEYGGPNEAFFALVLFVMALFTSAYALLAVLRLRSEESSLRAEPLLSASVERVRWAVSHIIFAIVGSTIIMITIGITSGLSSGVIAGDVWSELSRTLGASIVKLPSIWVMAGIAVLLFGLLPKLATGLSWGIFGIFLIIQSIWELGQVNQAVFNLSPFAYVYPNHSITAMPLVILTLIAGILIVGGLIGFRHREIG